MTVVHPRASSPSHASAHANEVSLPRKTAAVALIALLVLNVFFAAFRLYGFGTFWLVIIATLGIGWLFGLIKFGKN